jgi:predicted nucleotidyltransferase
MLYGLPQRTIEDASSIFAKYNCVDEVILYGSRAKGNDKPGSDIDLSLKGEKITLLQLNKICTDLDNLLTPYTFDLSIFDHISNPNLMEHIERVGITFYKRKKM